MPPITTQHLRVRINLQFCSASPTDGLPQAVFGVSHRYAECYVNSWVDAHFEGVHLYVDNNQLVNLNMNGVTCPCNKLADSVGWEVGTCQNYEAAYNNFMINCRGVN